MHPNIIKAHNSVTAFVEQGTVFSMGVALTSHHVHQEEALAVFLLVNGALVHQYKQLQKFPPNKVPPVKVRLVSAGLVLGANTRGHNRNTAIRR